MKHILAAATLAFTSMASASETLLCRMKDVNYQFRMAGNKPRLADSSRFSLSQPKSGPQLPTKGYGGRISEKRISVVAPMAFSAQMSQPPYDNYYAYGSVRVKSAGTNGKVRVDFLVATSDNYVVPLKPGVAHCVIED